MTTVAGKEFRLSRYPHCPPKRPSKTALQVLVVDQDPAISRQLTAAVDHELFDVVHARSLDDALAHLGHQRVDLALIDDQLPDGDASKLADELAVPDSLTQTIMICGDPTFDAATSAIRAGAADVLHKPLPSGELVERVQEAAIRHAHRSRERRRVRRLKRTCRRLSQMRTEVTEQVDVLCRDLVTAYQDLAEQMQQAITATEFAAVASKELDIEQLLRKTLEHILHTAGPTNAAVFLPSGALKFSLGGYINYDCAGDSLDMLLDHLADVLAGRVAEHKETLHLASSGELAAVLGDDSAYLVDRHILAFACSRDDEVLAVVILFRDQAQPFDQNAIDMAKTMGPMLGDYLTKLIRIHHRHLEHDEEDL